MEANTESAQEAILNIIGEKVALGPHRKDLLSLYQRWINDFGVARMLGPVRPLSFALYKSAGISAGTGELLV